MESLAIIIIAQEPANTLTLSLKLVFVLLLLICLIRFALIAKTLNVVPAMFQDAIYVFLDGLQVLESAISVEHIALPAQMPISALYAAMDINYSTTPASMLADVIRDIPMIISVEQ